MNAFFYSELSTSELPNELRFSVDRKTGWFFLVVWPTILAVLLAVCLIVIFTQEYPPDWSIGIAIGAAINLVALPIMLALARRRSTTALSVTDQRLAAKGRGVGSSPFLSSTVNIPLSEVSWLGYLPSNTPGLYVSCGLMKNDCILPGLDGEQASTVTDAIARRFPQIGLLMQGGR
jgi:hypothetical protein